LFEQPIHLTLACIDLKDDFQHTKFSILMYLRQKQNCRPEDRKEGSSNSLPPDLFFEGKVANG